MTERQVANNAKWQLLAWISSIATTMLMKDWMEDRFPTHNGTTDKDYYVTLKKYDTDWVSWTKQEIVRVTARSWNSFTITRSAWSCPASSSATTQTNTAFSFDADDYIEMTDVAEITEEMRSAINDLDTDKADDSAVVHKIWDETVAWIKTFPSSPIVPTPTTDYQVAPKKYVDDLLASVSATVSSAIAWEALTAWNAIYIASDWKAYKTDATDNTKVWYIWFAKTSVSAWSSVNIDNTGVSSLFTWLSVWSKYFLFTSLQSDISQTTTWNWGAVWPLVNWTDDRIQWQTIGATSWFCNSMTFNVDKNNYDWDLVFEIREWTPTASTYWWWDVLYTETVLNANIPVWDIVFTLNIMLPSTYYILFRHTNTSTSNVYYKVTTSSSNTYADWYHFQLMWTSKTDYTDDFVMNIDYEYIAKWSISTTPWTYAKEVWLAVSETELLIKNLTRKTKWTSAWSATVTVWFYPVLVLYTSTDNASAYFDEAGISNKTQTWFDIDWAYDRVAFW